MKSIRYKANGFTLIETLVVINLSLLIFALLISFYLFVSKYSSTVEKKVFSQAEVSMFLGRVHEKLQKTESFYINAEDSILTCTINANENISFGNDYIKLNPSSVLILDSVYVDISLIEENELLSINNGSIQNRYLVNQSDGRIYSHKIKTIRLLIRQEGREYRMNYFVPANRLQSFQNLYRSGGPKND